MSVVLVHGNPEKTAVWDPLRAALDRHDVVCLSPPGFGAPLPNSWGATVEDYRDWLISNWSTWGPPWTSWATTGEEGTSWPSR